LENFGGTSITGLYCCKGRFKWYLIKNSEDNEMREPVSDENNYSIENCKVYCYIYVFMS
jgi:hypothetical protein